MTKPLSKEKLVLLKWFSLLDTEPKRKCEGSLRDGDKVCAIGLIGEAAGISVSELTAMARPSLAERPV